MGKRVVNLAQARQEAGRKAHERGEAFKFFPYTYDDGAVGVPEGMPEQVCVVLNQTELTGMVMSRRDARLLAVALLQTAAAR
jgi:hypothetical protein